MKKINLIILLIVLINFRAICQDIILESTEVDIVNKVTSFSKNKINYFVFIDKSDCFACTISSKIIDQYIEPSRVFVLVNDINEINIDKFKEFYQLNENFNFTINSELFDLLKSKATDLGISKSFIIEVNSSFASFIPLKEFQNTLSFGKKYPEIINKINFKESYINIIPKFEKFKEGYVYFTSPKNEIIFKHNDSAVSTLKITDSVLFEKGFDFLIQDEMDSVKLINSFPKSMETYHTQIEKFGLPIFSIQNFVVEKQDLLTVVKFSLPIWKSSSNIRIKGALFCMKLQISDNGIFTVSEFYPIKNENKDGSIINAYNFLHSDSKKQELSIGLFLDSNVINDISENYLYQVFSLKNDIFSLSESSSVHHPEVIIKRYQDLQNLALIFKKFNEDMIHYTYTPIISLNKKIVNIPLNLSKSDTYRSINSDFKNNILSDLCSVNGKYYFIQYEMNNTLMSIINLIYLNVDGVLNSAIINDNSVEYLYQKNGEFHIGSFKFD